MKNKRFIRSLLLLLICALLLTPTASAATYTPAFPLTAKSALLINLDNGSVIFERDTDAHLEPSLLAQMMTAILVIERIDDLDNTMISMPSYIQNEMYIKNVELDGIRLAGLYRNEELSARKLLYALLLRDAGEAAMMLADEVADGSMNYFAELMNERAKELGATNTHFTGPTGLADSNSYTTAHDIAIIAQHALTLPEYVEIMNTTFFDGGPTNMQETLYWNTTNKLIVPSSEFYHSAVSGIKTGWHDELGSYAVTTAKKDGYTYLCVVMGCTGDNTMKPYNAAFIETARLYNWAFETFKVKVLLEEGKSFGEVPLRLAADRKDFLRVRAAKDFTALIPAEIEASSIRYDLRLPKIVDAPVKEGDLIGEVHLILAQEEIGVVGVVAAESAEVSRLLLTFEGVAKMFSTLWFKFIIVFVFMLVVLYVALTIMRNHDRRRYSARRRKRY